MSAESRAGSRGAAASVFAETPAAVFGDTDEPRDAVTVAVAAPRDATAVVFVSGEPFSIVETEVLSEADDLSADGETFSLETARSRGDARDRAGAIAQIGREQLGQREDVLNGHSRHVHLRVNIEFSITCAALPGTTVFLASHGRRRSEQRARRLRCWV